MVVKSFRVQAHGHGYLIALLISVNLAASLVGSASGTKPHLKLFINVFQGWDSFILFFSSNYSLDNLASLVSLTGIVSLVQH